MRTKALITGITRQDGSYPAEFLLSRRDMRFMEPSGAPAVSIRSGSTGFPWPS